MNPDLSTALGAGVIVLFCALLILLDVVWEHRHRVEHDADADARRRDLLREIRRHD